MTGSNVINVLKGGSGGLCPPGAKAFLLVTDNRRSWLDSEELTMQLSDFIFCYRTNQSFKHPNYKSHEKDLVPAPSSFSQFLYNLKINFSQIVLMGKGFSGCFLSSAAVAVEERL